MSPIETTGCADFEGVVAAMDAAVALDAADARRAPTPRSPGLSVPEARARPAAGPAKVEDPGDAASSYRVAGSRPASMLNEYNIAVLLSVDEIGYLPVIQGGGNLFFQLVNARYERGAMVLTSNRGFAEWGEVFGDPVVATALLDRLLHHAVVIQIEGSSYRLRQHADLMPENVRTKAFINPPIPAQPPRRRGRPPKHGASDHATG